LSAFKIPSGKAPPFVGIDALSPCCGFEEDGALSDTQRAAWAHVLRSRWRCRLVWLSPHALFGVKFVSLHKVAQLAMTCQVNINQLVQVVSMRYMLTMSDTDQTEPKDQRVVMMMTCSELKAVDDWSFETRIRSRGEALRQLVAFGLELVAQQKAKGKGAKGG
jgi:hypothetical protein